MSDEWHAPNIKCMPFVIHKIVMMSLLDDEDQWADDPMTLTLTLTHPDIRVMLCNVVKVHYLCSISFLYGFKYGSNCSNVIMPGTMLGVSSSVINMNSAPNSIYAILCTVYTISNTTVFCLFTFSTRSSHSHGPPKNRVYKYPVYCNVFLWAQETVSRKRVANLRLQRTLPLTNLLRGVEKHSVLLRTIHAIRYCVTYEAHCVCLRPSALVWLDSTFEDARTCKLPNNTAASISNTVNDAVVKRWLGMVVWAGLTI